MLRPWGPSRCRNSWRNGYRLRPRSGRQSFRVHAVDEAMARALKLDGDTPVLLVKRTLDFPAGTGRRFCRAVLPHR